MSRAIRSGSNTGSSTHVPPAASMPNAVLNPNTPHSGRARCTASPGRMSNACATFTACSTTARCGWPASLGAPVEPEVVK